MTQKQMEMAARRKALVPYKVFNDIMSGPNPLTKAEIRKLIERNPALWGRFRAWAD